MNTEVIGAYTLTYTVSDAAGNTAVATRIVNVIGNRASFSFSDKGKSGASFNHSFNLAFPGTATITATGVDNKTQITVTIKNSAGNTVFSGAFSTSAARTVDLAAGSYTATIRIDNTNGNTTVGVTISVVEGEGPPDPPIPVLESILADPAALTLVAGASQALSITAVYSDGSRTALTAGVTLISSNTGVASIDRMTVRAVAPGVATITASYGGFTVDIPIQVDPPPVQPPSPPSVRLIGSPQLVLHLGGSPYVEQGVDASDAVDGDLSAAALIESDVDTSSAGNYTVKYTVTKSAGLYASATRYVEVLAPQIRTLPVNTYGFSPKGKQGESFNYNIVAVAEGNISFTLTLPNNTKATATVTGASGEVFRETFTTTATRSFPAPAGNYTFHIAIDSANGNANLGLSVSTPGGTETYFTKPEVTR